MLLALLSDLLKRPVSLVLFYDFTLTSDFHPTCVGYVSQRFPSHCIVNRDVYVPNKLLEQLPAPVRVGRTQLRLAVKSVNHGINVLCDCFTALFSQIIAAVKIYGLTA